MTPPQPTLPQSDLLRLWEYFHEKGDKVKERLWEIAVWHFTVLTGVLGFIGKEFLQKPECAESALEFNQPQVVLLLAGLGILLSVYSLAFIRAYGNHVILKWAIADQIRGMIPGLTEAVELEEKTAPHKDVSKVKEVAPELEVASPEAGVIAHKDGAEDKEAEQKNNKPKASIGTGLGASSRDKEAEQKNNKPKDRKRDQWIPDITDARLLMVLTAIYLLIFIVLAIIAGLQMT